MNTVSTPKALPIWDKERSRYGDTFALPKRSIEVEVPIEDLSSRVSSSLSMPAPARHLSDGAPLARQERANGE